MSKLLLVGGGGHCKSVLDCLDRSRFDEIVISDRQERLGQQIMGVPIAVTDEMWPYLRERGFSKAFLTLGGVRVSTLRGEMTRKLQRLGFSLIQVVASEAVVSSDAFLEEGVFVGKGAVVNAGAYVGQGAILNSGVIVEHDVQIGAFAHIAPGCVLCGGVRVGEYSHIGAGATVIQGVKVGMLATIGAGSVVLREIGDRAVAYGVPCKAVKI